MMNDESNDAPPVIPTQRPSRTSFVVWAIGALAVAAALSALFIVLRRPGEPATVAPAPAPLAPTEEALPATAEAPVETKDFSASNCVSIILGEAESGNGLTHLCRERDGVTTNDSVNGVACRHLDLKAQRSEGYLCFQIDPTFKTSEVFKVLITVEYYDGTLGSFGIHYDAIATPGRLNPAYTRANPSVLLRGSNEWKKAVFRIYDAAFVNRENGGADFRITIRPAELYVRRVTVTRMPESAPAAPVATPQPPLHSGCTKPSATSTASSACCRPGPRWFSISTTWKVSVWPRFGACAEGADLFIEDWAEPRHLRSDQT